MAKKSHGILASLSVIRHPMCHRCNVCGEKKPDSEMFIDDLCFGCNKEKSKRTTKINTKEGGPLCLSQRTILDPNFDNSEAVPQSFKSKPDLPEVTLFLDTLFPHPHFGKK